MKPKATRRKTSTRKKSPARKGARITFSDKVAKFFTGKNSFWRQVRTKGSFASIARSLW